MVSFLPTGGSSQSWRPVNSWPFLHLKFTVGRGRKLEPAIVNQALQAVRCHVEGRGIERIFIPYFCIGTLALQNPVNLTLHPGQVRFRLRCSNALSYRVESIEALFTGVRCVRTKKFPGRRSYRDDSAENHRREEN